MAHSRIERFWESSEWNPYSDVENAIIEDAYQASTSDVNLDNYHIDFEQRIQISTNDSTEQHAIKRMEINRENDPLREARFMSNPIIPSISFHNLAGKQCEAKWLVEQLDKAKSKSKKEIGECCVYLYTLESFLYKILNQTMRLIGDKQYEHIWKKKIETLGPFAFLLNYYLSFENVTHRTSAEVYRGAQLTDEVVEEYRKAAQSKDKRRSFQAFTSCSRNRKKAEQYGNVLFILKPKTRTSYRTLNMNIAALSAYSNEEEVLLRPGRSFEIENVDYDSNKRKYIIYLTLISTRDTN